MSAPRYTPDKPTASTAYATVQAVNGGLCDLDFGDGDPVLGVPVFGDAPGVGDRVMVLLQGRGAMVIPPVAHADHHHPERQTSTWTYDTSTTMADPGSGKVRGNSTGESQTQIAISHINSNGTSVSLWIEAIAAGDRIRFQEAANSDTWAIYNITAVTHNSGWSLLDVARTSVGPGEDPKKNTDLLVTVEYASSGGGGSSDLVVPRLRGQLPNRSQPTGGSESQITGTVTVYDSDRISVSNGTFTVTEGGIYVIGGLLQTSVAPTAEQRVLFSMKRGSIIHRFSMGRSERYAGWSFVDAMSAGSTFGFYAYQNTGSTNTYSDMYINIAKVASL